MIDEKKYIMQKNLRDFREKFKNDYPKIVSVHLKEDTVFIWKTFELYSVFQTLWFLNDFENYWIWLNWWDEKWIDFIYYDKNNILHIFNCKSWKSDFGIKPIEEILNWLKCIFEWEKTTNPKLLNFVKNTSLINLKEINIYYCTEEWNNKNQILWSNPLKVKSEEIEKYNEPIHISSSFTWIKFNFLNYEELFDYSWTIDLIFPFKDQYFFQDWNRVSIARISCESIKEVILTHWNNVFQKNIRWWLKTKINKEIKNSLELNPNDFFLLNNWVTIVWKNVFVDKKNSTISIINAQIINWQQTCLNISKVKKIDPFAFVLCRFFAIDDDKIIYITKSTNSQNSTTERDFVSNDNKQKAFQEYFYNKKIFYERKMNEYQPVALKNKIKNNDFAQCCLATILKKPSYSRIPKPKIFFTDDVTKKTWEKVWYYSEIFSQDIKEMESAYEKYLICKWKITKWKKKWIILKNEWWLHIASIWYNKKCADYDEASLLFEEFVKKNDFHKLMVEWEKPLNKIDSDEKLFKFLKSK